MYSQEIINKIIYKEYLDRVDNLKTKNIRLAHYTSAAVALSIIENKTIWLNNVCYMNDYSEIEIGNRLLMDFYKNDTGVELREIMDEIHKGCTNTLEQYYDHQSSHLMNTYAFCLTEHTKEEDEYGRLSMWRAYGLNNGVALVFNTSMFLEEAVNTNVMTIPMFYFDKNEFSHAISEFTRRLKDDCKILKMVPNFDSYILDKFFMTALSLKHKGFEEECEWRVLYNKSLYGNCLSEIIEENIEVINGVPRIVKKLNFSKIKYNNRKLKINELLDRIIIGPNSNAEQLKEIFVRALKKNGVANANTKVICSEIPLRK